MPACRRASRCAALLHDDYPILTSAANTDFLLDMVGMPFFCASAPDFHALPLWPAAEVMASAVSTKTTNLWDFFHINFGMVLLKKALDGL